MDLIDLIQGCTRDPSASSPVGITECGDSVQPHRRRSLRYPYLLAIDDRIGRGIDDGFVAIQTASNLDDVSTASGIDTAMMSVLRQLPKETRIMIPVRHAAIKPSRTTELAALTKTD